MITQYAILVTKLEQGGWLAQILWNRNILGEATSATQLDAISEARRKAEPAFVREAD